MKKYLVLLVVLFFCNVALTQETILLKEFKINGHISRGDSKSQVLSKLGVPTKETNDFNEMDETNVLILHYGDSKLYFENNMLSSFEIEDTSLHVSYLGNQIKVGQGISSVSNIFPQSYSKRNEGSHGGGMRAVHLMLFGKLLGGTQEVKLDEFINIRYDPNTLLIVGISHSRY
ncbi:hypothetical protein [uncultured Roseivirga sp.]|uniref:hypothetical protein n=1 Tax=uncultured Roseivirga sp. TaxID=543088 RepID=UPI0030D98FD0|tara:strand:- start:15051 stop:15572 length:522 start_codon:yes stop_codon:yes gene_type:complete